MTGVSYRFGHTCHVNSHLSAQDFWIPLIVVSAMSLGTQLITLAYCVHAYVKSLYESNSSGLPSQSGTTIRSVSARQAYRRVREVVKLQWRGLGLSFVMVAHVILLSVVFMDFNGAVGENAMKSERVREWIQCLALAKGDKDKCFSKSRDMGPGEDTVMAALCLLSLVGFWNVVFLMRPSMIHGWVDLVKRRFGRRHREFVSVDALRNPRPYEMLSKSAMMRSEVRSQSPLGYTETRSLGMDDGEDGLSLNYSRPPHMSFSSSPHPPTAHGREWNPEDTFAPSYRLG